MTGRDPSPRPESRRISVVVDPPGGWFDAHAAELVRILRDAGREAAVVDRQAEVPAGDIAFYLSCVGITPPGILARNAVNAVVHASALPQGRGFSPLVWQILEGRNEIPLTMIEMTPEVDAGDILMQRTLHFDGHELNDEMRDAMGAEIVAMCADFARSPGTFGTRPQSGPSSWYRRRRAEDSRLDPDRSLAAQFNLLRVVDNQRYPAFFDHCGHRYVLRIEKQPLPSSKRSGED